MSNTRLASERARARRRVARHDRHGSPGLARVLVDGRYDHPHVSARDAEMFGVLLFKPATVVSAAVLEGVAERAAECGYAVAAARTIQPDELRRSGAMRRHYAPHWEVARAGSLQPDERLRLLAIYDRPDFEERYGVAAADVPVVPALQSGISLATINAWSEASASARGLNSGAFDGPNEVGELTYVNLFVHPDGTPVFLLNPHLPSVTGWFEHSPTPLVALLIASAADDALSWKRMRSEFCGGSDPSTSPPGSLRRDMWDGVWPLRYVDGIDAGRAHNGVHLSNGPVEAVREASIWFSTPPDATAMGRTLIDACGGSTAFLDAEYVWLEGRPRVLVDATRDLTAAEAARVLAAGTLASVRDQRAAAATTRRIDLAHRVARELERDADVTAVLVGGSVARNRASNDSDLDVIVITAATERAGLVERVERSGVMVELDWMLPDDAIRLAATGEERDVRELRRSARLSLALPVYDPHAIGGDLAAAARAARPDLRSAAERLIEAYGALAALADEPARRAADAWETLRGVYDVIAFLLLLASPLRYQKPKWVVADLRETGNADVAEALLHAYGVDGDATRAAAVVESSAAAVARMAARLGLPPAETVRELGLVAEYPEYSYLCHCVDDARSLLADGRFADAAYAAKFNVRMAQAICESDDDVDRVLAEGVPDSPPDAAELERCLVHLDRCKGRLVQATSSS